MLYSPIFNLYFVQKYQTIKNSNFDSKREKFIVELARAGSVNCAQPQHAHTYRYLYQLMCVHDTERIL